MGSGDIGKQKICSLHHGVLILCLAFCVLHFVAVDLPAEPAKSIIGGVIEPAKLSEEINLSGVTLKEIIGARPVLFGLKQINLKTYQLPEKPTKEMIETLKKSYETEFVDEKDWGTVLMRTLALNVGDQLVSGGWQPILRRMDEEKAILICGKEKEGERENLAILIFTPAEFSELNLVGEIELSALDELRRAILQSMPAFDKIQLVENVFGKDTPPLQDMDSTFAKLESEMAAQTEKVPLDMHYQLGTLYERLGKYDKALEHYIAVIGRPDANEGWLKRAYMGAYQISKRQRKLEDAEAYKQALFDMGDKETRNQRYDEAAEIHRKQVQERFGSENDMVSWLLSSLARFHNMREKRITEKPMKKAEDMLYRNGEPEKAIEMYQAIIDSDPTSSDAESAQSMIGTIYGLLNQPEKQIEAFKKAAEGYPGSANYKYLGEAYQHQGMYEEALEQFMIVVEKYPNSYEFPYAYLDAAKCAESLGMTEKAKGYYQTISQQYVNDKRPGITAEKALIRMERGDDQPFLGLGFNFTSSMDGAPISTVFKNGPCHTAGVKPGDILLSIDPVPTPNTRSVIKIIGWDKNIGDEIKLLVQRTEKVEYKKTRTVKIKDGEEKAIEIPEYQYNKKVIGIPVILMKAPEKLER